MGGGTGPDIRVILCIKGPLPRQYLCISNTFRLVLRAGASPLLSIDRKIDRFF
jgi:hypothetical protein